MRVCSDGDTWLSLFYERETLNLIKRSFILLALSAPAFCHLSRMGVSCVQTSPQTLFDGFFGAIASVLVNLALCL